MTAECQHTNAPPRQMPGRVVIGPSVAPRPPSQHCGQRRHHQDFRPTKPVFASSPFAIIQQIMVCVPVLTWWNGEQSWERLLKWRMLGLTAD